MSLSRRRLLAGLAASTITPSCVSWPMSAPANGRMPVVFVAHGAPPLLDEVGWLAELKAWGAALPRPRAIVVVSAHWETDRPAIGATRAIPLVYDFYGFPERYYRVQYRTPDAQDVAARVRALLTDAGSPPVDAPERGLDHGVYIPLMPMFAAADIPVLQVSLPTLSPARVLALGQALLPLRDEGVLIMGSGFLTHNLRAGILGYTPSWASEFDAWAAEALRQRDVDALVDFERRAPAARMAHPRAEHYVPALVTAAALSGSEPVTFPIEGFWMGGFTKRSVQIG